MVSVRSASVKESSFLKRERGALGCGRSASHVRATHSGGTEMARAIMPFRREDGAGEDAVAATSRGQGSEMLRDAKFRGPRSYIMRGGTSSTAGAKLQEKSILSIRSTWPSHATAAQFRFLRLRDGLS